MVIQPSFERSEKEGFTTDLMNEVNQVLVLNKLSTLRFLTPPWLVLQYFLKNKIKDTLKAPNEHQLVIHQYSCHWILD